MTLRIVTAEMDKAVNNKVCCITGGARGIGASLVKTFSDAGYRVAFTYISENSFAAAAALDIKDRVVSVRCDSSCADGAAKLLALALGSFGRADVLINNAGSALYKLIQDTTDADYGRAVSGNLTSVFVNSREFARYFISKQSGRIINISSIWGVVGAAMESVYSAAKAGVIGFTKSLAKELAPSGITVNAIAPGVIKTDMLNGFSADELSSLKAGIPLGRLGEPSDIASAALFLASDDANYMTGQVLNINGGFLV